ncbi:MAG: carboxypeptidase regulatory-like domain-containing protein, partial [Aureliella sp.]
EDFATFRTHDVFARTVTGPDGQFRFENVKAPALPDYWTNSWEGDVVAVHPQLGIANAPLISRTKGEPIVQQLTLGLRPVTTISGRLVTPDQQPLAGADVSIVRMESPELDGDRRSSAYMGLQSSQLTPQAKTDAQGEFVFENIPQGGVAFVVAHHPDWVNVSAYIATSDEIRLGEHNTRIPGIAADIVASPATLVADPGVTLTGKVIDEDDQPIAGAKVSWSSSPERFATDAAGEFRMRMATRTFEWRLQQSSSAFKFFVTAPENGPFLSRFFDFTKEELAAQGPLTIRLERGVQVTGKVVTADGEPAAGINVGVLGEATVRAGSTDEAGNYKLAVPKRNVTLVASTDKPGYQLPSTREVWGATEEQAKGWSKQAVDLSDGVARSVEPIVITAVKPLQVIVSLPDGQPAVGASLFVNDPIPIPSGPLAQQFEPISEQAETGAQGRASLLTKRIPSEAAKVEVRLVSPSGAWFASAPIKNARDGVVPVVLSSGWKIKGRVLVDGQPVIGATISIGQAEPIRSPTGRPMGARITASTTTATDADGRYVAAVPAGHEYHVNVQSVPDYDDAIHVGFRPEPAVDGVLEVKDIELVRGHEEIAGTVVDINGKPVAGANVRIWDTQSTSPYLWLGHRAETTDVQGRFRLKNIPAGTYQVMATTPFVRGTSTNNATAQAKTGEMNLRLTLATEGPTEIPRLQPRKIIDLE